MTDNTKTLLEALRACVAALERADTSEGVCCCGASMDGHGHPLTWGHSPVDAGDYHAARVIAREQAPITIGGVCVLRSGRRASRLAGQNRDRLRVARILDRELHGEGRNRAGYRASGRI